MSLSPANDRAELSQVDAVQDDVRPSRESMEGTSLTATQVATESKRDDANSAVVARTFWRAFLRGLSEAPPSPATRPSLRWPALVLLALALAAAGGAIRLLLGLWGVRQLRNGSQPVTDAGLHDEIERLRRDLGCRRPVEARVSPHLASPVTVGWQRGARHFAQRLEKLEPFGITDGACARDRSRRAERLCLGTGRAVVPGGELLPSAGSLAGASTAMDAGVGGRCRRGGCHRLAK